MHLTVRDLEPEPEPEFEVYTRPAAVPHNAPEMYREASQTDLASVTGTLNRWGDDVYTAMICFQALDALVCLEEGSKEGLRGGRRSSGCENLRKMHFR